MTDEDSPGDPPKEASGGGEPQRLTGAGLLGLGIANAACLVLGLVLGHAADRHFDSAPAGVLVGITSGIVLGVVGSVFEIRRYLN